MKNKAQKDSALVRAESVITDSASSEVNLLAEYISLSESYRKLHHKLHKTLFISDSYQRESKDLNAKLQEAMNNFQKLKEVALPICMVCHKIRATNDYWERLEEYFAKHADIMFSHGICPDCVKVTYGKLGEKILAKQKSSEVLNNPEKAKTAPEDESLREMRNVLERAVNSENPMVLDIEKIVKSHTKVLRRFDKIVLLSDSYQSQLRDFNLRLELMARTDPLTGINNRGYFMELLRVEIERATRYGRVFAVLMIDLDHFKIVNDTMGHAAGDEALRVLTQVLQKSELRMCDFIGRIGGEEFAVTLPETDIKSAEIAAERVRNNLAKTTVLYEGREFFITASIGVSEYREGDTEESILGRADKAMYSAKDAGRNQVCSEL